MERTPTARRLVPAEQAVLLMLGGQGNDDEIAALLRRNIDWSALLALAHTERATAELHRRIRATGVAVPEPSRSTLERLSMIAEFESAYLAQSLRETLAAIGALDVRVMLLKGAALVHSVYGRDFSRRPMADIDLLVDTTNAAVVQRSLTSGRWRETVTGSSAAAYHDHQHLAPLTDARGGTARLELHTELLARGHPFGLTAKVVWAAAEPVEPGAGGASARGQGPYVPAIVHQLLHTCVHFAWSHVMRFGAWRTFRDVGAIVESGRVDWDAFVGLAREMRAATACYWTFRLARTTAGVEVPPSVPERMRPRRPMSYLQMLERHYVLNLLPATRQCPSVRLDRALWEMGMLPLTSGFGDARPWDRDLEFSGATAPSSAGARRAAPVRLWHAVRYLSSVVGREATYPGSGGTGT